LDENGEPILYADQDESLWNPELISKGGYFLNCASVGENMSRYHLEAAIAYWSTIKTDSPETWKEVLNLYNRLLQMEYSSVAALNRSYAVYKIYGKEVAIAETESLQLTSNPFYFSLLGELYTGIDREKARRNFNQAYKLIKTDSGKQLIQKKIDTLDVE
jgi:RNA polymerase sigma-70 factor (ECF subfamily)